MGYRRLVGVLEVLLSQRTFASRFRQFRLGKDVRGRRNRWGGRGNTHLGVGLHVLHYSNLAGVRFAAYMQRSVAPLGGPKQAFDIIRIPRCRLVRLDGERRLQRRLGALRMC